MPKTASTPRSPDPADRETLLEQLQLEHRALEVRLSELDGHLSLTSDEQLEWARLKKLKLWTKDQIQQLMRQ